MLPLTLLLAVVRGGDRDRDRDRGEAEAARMVSSCCFWCSNAPKCRSIWSLSRPMAESSL
jgi:hypothetical protein